MSNEEKQPAKKQQRRQRGHGEGSIYQRKDGRWVGVISLEAANGKRKRKPFYGKTRKEVQDKLNAALHEQKRGTLATGPQQTLKNYLEHWLEEVHKPTIRISTYYRYRGVLDNHIIPALGHIPIQKLTPQKVQTLYAKKLNEGQAPGSILKIHQLLHRALDNAVRWNLVSRNVCDTVTPPRRVKSEVQALTKEQAQKLLKTASGHRLETLITLALATGMRRGEILALRWSDINLDDGSLQVRRTRNRVGKNGVVESSPKTVKSKRRIVLPRFVVKTLEEHRARQLEAQLKAGDAWQDQGWVFCNIHGSFLEPTIVHRLFKTLLKDAGLPEIRFHDLRHTAATFLLSMGVHPKVVQEILGHSQISITMDTYSHVLPGLQGNAMDKMDIWFRE